MREPRSRRTLLASALPVSIALAGCFEFTSSDETTADTVSPDEYDCDDVERPEPSPSDDDAALEPASYPERLASLSDDAVEFVEEFEAAYRRNGYIAEYGSETREFEFQLDDRESELIDDDEETDREAVLVSITYELTTQLRQASPRSNRLARVTYYVDENIVLRARYDGFADEAELDPDPRQRGEPVACFD
ncbi:hypothetical protein [Natronolimnohabitans innermongolicus]|uniref:Lipoprotein n=1 Tax=Natronolimnohabitans innermongolicus JCM 12255 TaxID=1227499 RepID=L9X5N1_9EURY|nr:hypothetical protein [Natronolimnohabitans innermongolicus]ELY55898.1 hypothetical protein C493_10483 [Natronolimnohabitans innermongolicus JCM 12255]